MNKNINIAGKICTDCVHVKVNCKSTGLRCTKRDNCKLTGKEEAKWCDFYLRNNNKMW